MVPELPRASESPLRRDTLCSTFPPIVGGRGGGTARPCVVLLHGLTAQHRAFTKLARALRGDVRVLAPDLRGRGDSGKPCTGYGLLTHARDVVRLLDAHGVDHAVLGGHSMGAFVALATAVRYPERVAGVVLLDGGWPRLTTVCDDVELTLTLAFGLPRTLLRLGRAFPGRDVYAAYCGDTPRTGDPDVRDFYAYDVDAYGPFVVPKAAPYAVWQDILLANATAPTAAELRGVTCPVALVRASAGFHAGSPPLFGRRTLERLGACIRLQRDVVLDGATHSSMLFSRDYPDRSAHELDEVVELVRARDVPQPQHRA